MTPKQIRWGILGTGRIAGVFARGLADSTTGKLLAVASRTQASADAFAKEFDGVQAFNSYEALLASDAIDAVYISTPHPFHADWAIRAAEAGKHILCEKPLTLNHSEAMAVDHAARAKGVLLAEAFMYRCHPQTRRLVELVRDEVIGPVRVIQASFGFAAKFHPDARLFNNRLGGGGILDVGCYPMSMARLLAGACTGQPFANPIEVTGAAHLLETTGVDAYASAIARFHGGLIAELTTGVRLKRENRLVLFGEGGRIEVDHPWIITGQPAQHLIRIHTDGNEPREEVISCERDVYALEADAVGEAIRAGKTEIEAMPRADTLGNLSALDAWRSAIGLTYESEQPEDRQTTSLIRGRSAFAAPSAMPTLRIPGLDKDLTRLVMGCDNQFTQPHGDIMWDAYFEAGGRVFDTARIYHQGKIERRLGHWLAKRKLRDKVTLIVKGAHPPYCSPEGAIRQLDESLEHLQTDHADLYFLHRDDPNIPVGEWIDALHEQAEAGKIRLYGGSNWTLERIEEANAYARRHGKRGFAAVSNNFSLAKMVDPVWPGCAHCSDPDSRAWLRERNFPIFAWSSQARGFFLGETPPSHDPELIRCWHSEDNFERRRRAVQLARELGTDPINIAGAYLLAQPFPVFPLIGPRTIAELHSTLRSLAFELSPEQCAWLCLDTDEKPQN